jgi:hypothetical protein
MVRQFVSRPARSSSASGHARPPRAIYQRAIERGNLLVAENMLREIGRVTLVEALRPGALPTAGGL